MKYYNLKFQLTVLDPFLTAFYPLSPPSLRGLRPPPILTRRFAPFPPGIPPTPLNAAASGAVALCRALRAHRATTSQQPPPPWPHKPSRHRFNPCSSRRPSGQPLRQRNLLIPLWYVTTEAKVSGRYAPCHGATRHNPTHSSLLGVSTDGSNGGIKGGYHRWWLDQTKVGVSTDGGVTETKRRGFHRWWPNQTIRNRYARAAATASGVGTSAKE